MPNPMTYSQDDILKLVEADVLEHTKPRSMLLHVVQHVSDTGHTSFEVRVELDVPPPDVPE